MVMVIRKSAKTIDEAVKLALDELKVEIEQVDINILQNPKSGFLGFGSKPALVEVSLKEEKKVVDEVSSDFKKVEFSNEVVSEEAEKIKIFLLNLITKMGTNGEIFVNEDEESISFNIENSEDFKMLIGKGGDTLESIQYILNIFARRNISLEKRIYFDVNKYKVKKEENIRQMAMTFAKKAIKYKKIMRLKPMNAYERRIVHATLHNMKGVFTVSEGDEPYRKVVIKPKY